MEYKDASFQRWLPTAADGGMYDVAEVHHNTDGLTLILTPDGPDRRSRTPHRLLLVWESALACQISNETYREDCWISDPQEARSFFVSRESSWLAACRAGSVLFPADAYHFLIVGTDMIADVLAADYPIVTAEPM